jgi:anhydro-N-acetylmuramic acid kinase
MRTFTEHIAFQIGKILQPKTGKLLISGGGVYNEFLIERIKNYLPTIEVIIPNDKNIKYKEALIFALLGVLKLRNEINVLASVTGAKQNHSSGEVF